jgi:hypothetical protein
MPELDEEVNAAKKGRLSTQGVVHLVNEVLRENWDRDAVALATFLPTFGKAAMVSQRLYSLEELRLNKIDTT